MLEMMNTEKYMAYVAHVIARDGFVPWKDYRFNKNVLPTSEIALKMLEEDLPINENDYEVAREAIMYARTSNNNEEVFSIVSKRIVPRFKTALAASTVNSYLTREEREYKKKKYEGSNFVSKVGEDGIFKVTIDEMKEYGSRHKKSYFYQARDENNNVFVFTLLGKTLDIGDTAYIHGRVTVHDTFNETRQTRLSVRRVEKV